MRIFYYFLTDIATGETKVTPFDTFIGDIGDIVTLSKKQYRVNDYALEYEELILPSDF